MDIVISFVDCKDKVWVTNYLSFIGLKENHHFLPKIDFFRFYNYDTIKYVFRGIDKFIPYVNNIFLVVSNIEQVPEYIDQSKIKVVLHKDFIPEQYLPLFNSTAIEMFLHKIPGLDEEFVYFNDDTIPISPIAYEELFKNGLPCLNFVDNYMLPGNPTYKHVKLSFFEAKNTVEQLTGKPIDYNGNELCPTHIPHPMLKSICEYGESENRHLSLLDFYLTPFRNDRNLNQYYWCDILYFLKKYVPSNIKLKHIITDDINELINLDNQGYQYLCINDSGSKNQPISEVYDIIEKNMNKIFPDKCKYEK